MVLTKNGNLVTLIVMGKLKQINEKLDAILEYLDVELIRRNGWEVREHKQEIGFHEKKK